MQKLTFPLVATLALMAGAAVNLVVMTSNPEMATAYPEQGLETAAVIQLDRPQKVEQRADLRAR